MLFRLLYVFVAFLAISHGPSARAADAVELTGPSGLYLVRASIANIRALPKTSGKRVGRIRRGELVQVRGRAKKTNWLAVAANSGDPGHAAGFIYRPSLLPFLDGRLDTPLHGVLREGGRHCDYHLKFEEELGIGKIMRSSDYWVNLDCRGGPEGPFQAYVFAFLIEVPYNLSAKPVFQIGVEVASIEGDGDFALSSSFYFRPEEARLTYGSTVPKTLARDIDITERTAGTVADALDHALAIATASWNENVWRQLAGIEVAERADDLDAQHE